MVVKILVTGFGPFGEWAENPTQLTVAKLGAVADPNVATHVFQTSYVEVQRDLPVVLDEVHPDCVLALGLAGNSETVRLEERAHNVSHSGAQDVMGLVHDGEIQPGAPEFLSSTLPLDGLETLLAAKGVAVSRSADAGGYLCNFVFYLLQHHAMRLKIERSGFVHLPDAGHYRQIHGTSFDTFEVVSLLVDALVG